MGQNKKYRHRKSIRLKGYDYRTPAWYFITICTQNRQQFFGTIKNEIMGLSQIGCVAYKNWAAIPNHFDHVKLDAFIVMPNHIHGLIGLMERPVGMRNVASLQNTPNPNRQFGPLKPGSVSAIIHAYKSSVTRMARKKDHYKFAWQSRFHDHIVRNDGSFERIHNYILNNPVKWKNDRHNET